MHHQRISLLTSAAILAVVAACPGRTKADDSFDRMLVESGYIHSPLPIERERSLEHRAGTKTVIARQSVGAAGDLSHWTIGGIGTVGRSGTVTTSGNGSIAISHPTSTGHRAKGSPDDPDYALYGHCVAHLDIGDADFEAFNRLAFDIRPQCDGARIVNINLIMSNDPAAPAKPGYNRPTGYHLIHLENNKWNRCYLEIGDLQRDHVKELIFSISLNGKDITTGDSATYYIDNLELQEIDRCEKLSGWEPAEGTIVCSMTGYAADGIKTAIVNIATAEADRHFEIIGVDDSAKVLSGNIKTVATTTGRFGLIDFSALTSPGRYIIKTGDCVSVPFNIGGTEIWDDSRWRVLNFIFCQRCGYHVPGIHGKCHTDLFAVHNGERIPYSGGWHDAGDLSQQTLQTGDVAYALLEASRSTRQRNPILSARLKEEALWGLDFVLRSRFGDGFHASSMGLLIWQDGKTDSFDDITSVRVQDVSFDNFLYSGYEAFAAMDADDDPAFKDYLTRIAKEDFDLATARYEASGFGGFINAYEHSYNTSMSQFMATISWAASQLYRLTGEERYAQAAVRHIGYVLDCQQIDPIDSNQKISGFFYRDKNRRSIVHYIHQSREQIYMQALTSLCETQPDHKDYGKWAEAVRLYGGYLKKLMAYTAPYGMIPSGVYRDDEYLDTEGFFALHLFPPANARELYTEQLHGGVKINDRFFVKRFPIWFNIFNGNLAVHASMGKAAAICGNFLHDRDLLDIGREQLYWIVGKNPFAQSLIYGEGYDYPQLNSFSSGEITGSMPVGIRTIGNSDDPYWPQINNACYKEVWVTSAGKWLSLLAEYDQ